MKKIFLIIGIILAVALILGLIFYNRPALLPLTEKDYASGKTGISNPITQYQSLEEINVTIGSVMKNYPQAEAENYTVISQTIGQYQFDGKYTLRAAKTVEDISGVYIDGQTVSALSQEDVIYSVNDNTYYVYWFKGDMQYSLYGINCNLSEFTEVYNFFKSSC
ncbi:MAG: hypothetical protein Q4C64_04895 [Erysipelotrichia bacterium]|nr:hypothetical protein [Erysipelotrichia bacterium]